MTPAGGVERASTHGRSIHPNPPARKPYDNPHAIPYDKPFRLFPDPRIIGPESR